MEFRIFYHLVDIIVINAWVLYRQVSAKTGVSVMNLQALRIYFVKACAS